MDDEFSPCGGGALVSRTDLLKALVKEFLHGEVKMVLNTVKGVAGVRVNLQKSGQTYVYFLSHILA